MLDQAGSAAETATALCARRGNDPAALIEILHDLQAAEGCVPQAALPAIAQALNLGRAEVHGVVSFYPDFRDAPLTGPEVQVCRAEACRARGALEMLETLRARGGAPAAAAAAARPVYCLGACASGPAARIDGRLHARLDADRLAELIAAAAAGETPA